MEGSDSDKLTTPSLPTAQNPLSSLSKTQQINGSDNTFTMSKNIGDALVDMPYPPSGSPSPSEFNELGDSSGPLFSIYSETIEERDNKKAERHQKDAEGVVIFTGLFSAAVAALVTVSMQDLRPGPQDKSDFYLESILQLLANPNVSRASISSTLLKPPPFSPPRYAIWVNSLWFSSLAISITSALLATLIQQWTRRYMKVTQPVGSPHKRARIRHHIFSDPHILHFLLATDAVPALLHLSVFLFFAGLLVLLRNIDRTVFGAAAVWVVLCVAAYAYITFLPIFHPASPHYAPLSSFVWDVYTYAVFKLVSLFRELRKGSQKMDQKMDPPTRLVTRVEEKAKELVESKSMAPKLDAQILESFFDTLVDDCALEKYFEAIPGFYHSGSQVVQIQDVKKYLNEDFEDKFWHSVDQFLDRSLSTDSFCESTRSRRLLTCLKATNTVLVDSQSADTGETATDRIFLSRNWDSLPRSREIWNILKIWHDSRSADKRIATMGICLIARIIASVKNDEDDTWKLLTTEMTSLWAAEMTLEGVDLEQGHNMFLANLIYTTRLIFKKKLEIQKLDKDILHSISGFDVRKTHPELQRSFCVLWNEILQDAQKEGSSSDRVFILREIGWVYNDLHPTSPIDITTSKSFLSSCPSCSNPQTHIPTSSQQGNAPPHNEPTTEHDTPHAPTHLPNKSPLSPRRPSLRAHTIPNLCDTRRQTG